MSKTVVSTDRAAGPFGGAPYSQAIVANGFVFTAGQVAAKPDGSGLVEGGIEEQTHQVMQNLQAVLEAAGSSLAKAVKTTVFLTDLADFPQMNEVYRGYTGPDFPARSTFQVAALPPGILVEIEAIATA